MIKNYGQAVAIQQRRVKAGKRGLARAVRRFLQRYLDWKGWKTDAETFETYCKLREGLPVNWDKPEKKDVDS